MVVLSTLHGNIDLEPLLQGVAAKVFGTPSRQKTLRLSVRVALVREVYVGAEREQAL